MRVFLSGFSNSLYWYSEFQNIPKYFKDYYRERRRGTFYLLYWASQTMHKSVNVTYLSIIRLYLHLDLLSKFQVDYQRFWSQAFIGTWSKSSWATWKHFSVKKKHFTPLEKVAQFKESRYLWGIFNYSVPRARKTTWPGRHYFYFCVITHILW